LKSFVDALGSSGTTPSATSRALVEGADLLSSDGSSQTNARTKWRDQVRGTNPLALRDKRIFKIFHDISYLAVQRRCRE